MPRVISPGRKRRKRPSNLADGAGVQTDDFVAVEHLGAVGSDLEPRVAVGDCEGARRRARVGASLQLVRLVRRGREEDGQRWGRGDGGRGCR